jgi:hypothetical protein
MHVQCSACQSTLALPQAIAVPTLIECTGCGHCFTAEPPRNETLRPVLIAKRNTARQKAAAAGPMTPIILPPRGQKSKATTNHSYSVIPTAVPAVTYEAYSVQSQPPPPQVEVPVTVLDDDPVVETYTSSHVPTAEPPKKKKKPKRFKKKVVDDSSDDTSSSFGAQLVYGLVVLGIMVVVGAVFGVGKFGWIKTNGLGQFNDKVVAIVERAGRALERESFITWNDANAQSVHRQVTAALQELRNLSVPSEGREFHQAAMQFLQRLDQVFTNEVSAIARMVASGNQRQAEQRAEQLFNELERMEDNVIRVQAEMAKRNNIQLDGANGSNFRRRPW